MSEQFVCTDWTPKKWWPTFFAKFAETGIVALAARQARISRSLVYQYRANSDDFRTQWKQAEDEAVGLLEDMATQRALKTSDTLLIFLLKTRARDKYGDEVKNVVTGPNGQPLVTEVIIRKHERAPDAD